MNKKIITKIGFIVIFTSLVFEYFNYDYEYHPNYQILEDSDAYASYSNGLIYIGNTKYLNNLDKNKISESDIIIQDSRYNSDPDMIIYNSHRIVDKEDRNEILEVICKYEECSSSDWNRTIESMRLEWFVHNLSYYLNYKKTDSEHVDLDNDDEQKYDKKVLRKILKI